MDSPQKMTNKNTSQNEQDENSIIVPSILDDVPSSPSKSLIKDFTENSLYFLGGEVVRISKDKPQILNDDSNVYMTSILDLLKRISLKIESICSAKDKNEMLIRECLKLLLIGDEKEAIKLLMPMNDVSIDGKDVFRYFTKDVWSKFQHEVKERVLDIKEIVLKIREVNNKCAEKLYKKAEECERLKNIINQQSIEHSVHLESLLSENTAIKENLMEIVSEYGTDEAKSQLTDDVIGELKGILNRQRTKIEKMAQRDSEREAVVENMKKQLMKEDVTDLKTQLEENKQRMKQLQEENMSFSTAIQKISEKNIKLKQDLSLFNSELKKSVEVINSKNEIIKRQKTLIELFQDKLVGTADFPIAELRRKKEELEVRIEVEKDFLKKQELKKQKTDCEKRLSDFIDLNSKPNIFTRQT